MSHRAEDDVGIRAESYSICQRTVAVAVSRIAGTMIIHVFGLCKFWAKFFHEKRRNCLIIKENNFT